MTSTSRLSIALLGILVLGAIVTSGGAHSEIVVILAVVSVACLGLVTLGQPITAIKVPRNLLGLLSILMIGAIVQWTPISTSWLDTILHANSQQYTLAYRGLEPPQFQTWSLDPTLAFHRSLNYFILIVCVIWVSWLRSMRKITTSNVYNWALSLGTLSLVAIFILELLQYRVFDYELMNKWSGLGPFINSNHGGGFAVIMTLWLIHTIQKTRGFYQSIAIGLSICYAALVVYSFSRGAIVSLGIGLWLGILLPVTSRRRVPKATLMILTAITVVLLSIAFVEREFLLPLLREFAGLTFDTIDSKLEPWRGVPELLRAYPLGTGIGGLYGTLPQVGISLTATGRVFFLENQVLQVLTDWGWVLGTGILCGFIATFRSLCNKRIMATNSFFVAGLVALGIHNLVDFNLTLLSTQLLLVVGYSAIFHLERCNAPTFALSSRSVLLVLVVSCSILSFGASLYGVHGLPVNYKNLIVDLNDATSTSEVKALLSSYKNNHPLDTFADLSAARRLTELNASRSEVLSRVNVAMGLQPHFAQPHLLATQVLLAYGATGQARGEFIRATRKNLDNVWGLSESQYTRLASADLFERAKSLEPVGRYRLWNWMQTRGIFVPEIVIRDEAWLEEPEFIRLRVAARVALGEFENVISDCEIWRNSYPGLYSCQQFELDALTQLGKTEQVLNKAKQLWIENRYSGDLAWNYLSRLTGDAGCKEFVSATDAYKGLIRFDKDQQDYILIRRVTCLVQLDYRNLFDSTVETILYSNEPSVSVLLHLVRTLKRERPKYFEQVCKERSRDWSLRLGQDITCE